MFNHKASVNGSSKLINYAIRKHINCVVFLNSNFMESKISIFIIIARLENYRLLYIIVHHYELREAG